MRFRPCIDIHNGRVKQIVGATLAAEEGAVAENFVATQDAPFFARTFTGYGLRGGHIVLLNRPDEAIFEKTRAQAVAALKETPAVWQIGGSVTPQTAAAYLDAGATHVIVTSYVFRNGRVDTTRLQEMVDAVGKERLVLDLSCKRIGHRYLVVTDRWKHATTTEVSVETLSRLAPSCDEFLIHAADAEGKRAGVEAPLIAALSKWDGCPVTYAGGVRDLADIELIEQAGEGRIDFTVGSALKLFGGEIEIEDILPMCETE